jgi:sugar transferase (PEP-CTERM/EpsH1 system associated)
LAHRIPYPPNKGDKIRSFNEIKYLAERHRLSLAFLIDEEKDLAHIDELRKYCSDLDYEMIKAPWQKLKSIPCLLTKKPLSVSYFYSKKLQERIDRRLIESKIDAVICFSSPMAEYIFKSKALNVRISRPPLLIMDFVDVDSDKWRMYAGFNKFPLSVIYNREWKTLMRYEHRVDSVFDHSIFVSKEEVDLFKSFCTKSMAVSIPNGVDHEFYRDVKIKQAKRLTNWKHILFMGAMDYFPNEDAVLYFSREIWPYVKKQIGKVKFYIVGGGLSRKIKRLSENEPDIVLTGYVSDVRPYLAIADTFIAPLRIARGIPNKVLEAMAFGVPVVASPEAVQGLRGYDGCLKVESTDDGFASAICDFIGNNDVRDRVITEARRFVIENHDWRSNFRKLDELIERGGERCVNT